MVLKRVVGPPLYVRGTGILNQIASWVRPLGSRVLISGGKTALSVSESIISSSLSKAGVEIAGVVWYGGECSWENIEHLAETVRSTGSHCIIGAGGGKALDTVKAAAFASQVPAVMVPTIAATCAAWTPLSAIYDERGEYLEFSRRAVLPAAVIVDTGIIARAPKRFLVSGLGDTLAKWYELSASTRGKRLSSPVQAALALGQVCKQVIVSQGEKACSLVEVGQTGDALDEVVDAVIALAGTVSGLGGDEARTAAAHAIYSGLTVVDEIHKMYHGEIVGFGILCQLIMEDRPEHEIYEFLDVAHRCGLPVTLAQMGVESLSQKQLARIAALALQVEDMATMPFAVTEEMVIQALVSADQVGSRYLAALNSTREEDAGCTG